MKPPSPIIFRAPVGRGDSEMVPVLVQPSKRPVKVPLGPQLEQDIWDDLDHLMEEARRFTAHGVDLDDQLAVIDHVYSESVKRMEVAIRKRTDTPRRTSSLGGSAPVI